MSWWDDALGWAGDILDVGGDLVGDLWDVGGDVVGDVGSYVGDIDWGDVAQTGGQMFGLYTPPGQMPYGMSPYGMMTGGGMQGGWNVPAIGNLLSGAYAGYRAGEEAEDWLAQQQPLQDLYTEFADWTKSYYDSTNLARLEAQETARMTEQAAPLMEAATYKGAASGLQRGQPWQGSTVGLKEQEAQQRAAGKLFSDVIAPRAAQNVAQAGATQANVYSQLGGLLSGQPSMQPTYQLAQQSPWQTALDSAIYRLQEKPMG